ncbi:MAG: hypothetical protein OXU26_06680 [Acidobacteriota bacterium]|nr:hypothetical protein [Acidobacteriota bacterium]
MLDTGLKAEGIVGDSTLVEFIRDIVVIVAGLALVLWLLLLAIIALVLVKKINSTVTAVRTSAHSLAEGGQALRDSFAGKNPFFGIAAAGMGRAIGALVRSAFRR